MYSSPTLKATYPNPAAGVAEADVIVALLFVCLPPDTVQRVPVNRKKTTKLQKMKTRERTTSQTDF